MNQANEDHRGKALGRAALVAATTVALLGLVFAWHSASQAETDLGLKVRTVEASLTERDGQLAAALSNLHQAEAARDKAQREADAANGRVAQLAGEAMGATVPFIILDGASLDAALNVACHASNGANATPAAMSDFRLAFRALETEQRALHDQRLTYYQPDLPSQASSYTRTHTACY